ncbi:DinB family protein [Actinopolymorpha alba]|uniref:DinB family protein n=1 Tax=Actinopolymorpha alba TaxID=533267 RepID=UPI0003803235|nr:DinB family protein [Actinopolymorpha alba]
MMANQSQMMLLRWQLDVAWSLLELHLADLDDAEILWEPAPTCWTVRPRADGRWVADWMAPDAEPEPEPAPSIAWLTWHIGFWWTLTYERSFGVREVRRDEVFWPGSTDATVEWLRACKDRWSGALTHLDDADLQSTARSGWFLRGTRPFGFVVAWVNSELMKNAAEIGLLRNLRQASLDGYHMPVRKAPETPGAA